MLIVTASQLGKPATDCLYELTNKELKERGEKVTNAGESRKLGISRCERTGYPFQAEIMESVSMRLCSQQF